MSKLSTKDIGGILLIIILGVLFYASVMDVDNEQIDKIQSNATYQLGYNDYPNSTYIEQINNQNIPNYAEIKFGNDHPIPTNSANATDKYMYGWYRAKHDKKEAVLLGINQELENRSISAV